MRLAPLVLIIAVLVPSALAAQTDSTRDSLATRNVIRASIFRTFVNDSPEHLLGLVPGVVLRGTERGLASASALSIRGGNPGAASVYIDGAPVRFNIPGVAGLSLGAASLAEATVTTGPPDLSFPDLRDGVIEYVTRGGGERFAGSFQAATDEGFEGVGYNRFAGGVGGPLPLGGATWFVGGTLTGQRSHYLGLGAENVPSYVPGGIDTTVVEGGQNVVLPRFVDRRAYDWGTELRGHVKVDFAYGAGSRVSLTGVANETQQRFFPGMFAVAPSLYTGARSAARLFVANWHQSLGSLRGRPVTLRVNASVASNQAVSGLLEPGSERATIDPALGITLETLRFTGADSIPTPVGDQLVRNIRTNTGWRVAFLNRDDLRNVQNSRANPYGMESAWVQSGLDGTVSSLWEKRKDLRASVEWEVGAGHHVTMGGDLSRVDVSAYESNLLRQASMNAYRSEPGRNGLLLSDRFERSTVRAELALRYDHFGSVGLFARVPGRIYSNPAFNRPAAITSDTGYANSVARVMTPGRSRNAVAVRAAIEDALGPRSTVRAAFGRWVEPPPLGLVLLHSNADLDFTNTSTLFGRDVDYGYATLAEVGARYAITDRLDADIAVYRRSGPQYLSRFVLYDDPALPGDIVNVNSLFSAGDVVNLGVDLAVDWRPSGWLSARAAYGLRLTDLGTTRTGSDNVPVYSTHSLTGAVMARPPGALLRGFEATALLRLTSGTWYSSAFVSPIGGTGAVTPPFDFVFSRDNDRLPWTKRLDVQLRRTVTVGPSEWSFFAEARNLFGWQNILALFTETGGLSNPAFRDQLLAVEFQNIEYEANGNNALAPNGDIALPADCSNWYGFTGFTPMNCVALKRAEARFGNGDGVYSRAERTTALHAFYNAFFGPQTFYGAGRSVRLGVEIRW